jgi:ABC-type sugar transport system ATPase subunit
MIEHDMDFIGRLCDPVIVHGRGPRAGRRHVDEVKNNEEVIEAYLGTGLKNKNKPPRRRARPDIRRAFLIGEHMTGGYGGAGHPA